MVIARLVNRGAGLVTRVRTLLALGPANIARVASYRLRLRLGVHPVQRLPVASAGIGPHFELRKPVQGREVPSSWPGTRGLFGWFHGVSEASPPDWFTNPLTGASAPGRNDPWWTIPDFDGRTGDIKGIWEASRLDWVVRFALRARGGDAAALESLNAWLADWNAHNPPYLGPNWKCAQEASIRVMHLALAARMLGTVRDPAPALTVLVEAHLRRIDPTLSYAVGQNNNHGTSEAAALFIGGSWLESLGDARGAPLARRGRARLEERGLHLLMADGTFSQYSVNYHRLVLDTFSVAELWRRELGLAPFSARLTDRVGEAVDWLAAMTDAGNGDAPNLGANDGANLLPLTDAPYRDYRPAIQLAGALFRQERYFNDVPSCDAHLAALDLAPPAARARAPGSRAAAVGGFSVLRLDAALAVLRVPRHRFRPGHADPLHVDLWVGGENCLRDDGSFSYNADAASMGYFGSVRAHNTFEFDDLEPMPRLGRFLWGNWLQAIDSTGPSVAPGRVSASAAYRTAAGATHSRSIELRPKALEVTDRVGGFRRRAVCRWRLSPGAWALEGHKVVGARGTLTVESDVGILALSLVEGWESRHYQQRSSIPVVEVELTGPGTVRTTYGWSS